MDTEKKIQIIQADMKETMLKLKDRFEDIQLQLLESAKND